MLHNLTSLIVERVDLNFKFNNLRCPHHPYHRKLCKLKVNKKNAPYCIIHHKDRNYCVKNYEIYCTKIQSKPFKILQIASQLQLTPNSTSYIYVENEKIYKVKLSFITESLLLHLNQSTINGDLKMIGM